MESTQASAGAGDNDVSKPIDVLKKVVQVTDEDKLKAEEFKEKANQFFKRKTTYEFKSKIINVQPDKSVSYALIQFIGYTCKAGIVFGAFNMILFCLLVKAYA